MCQEPLYPVSSSAALVLAMARTSFTARPRAHHHHFKQWLLTPFLLRFQVCSCLLSYDGSNESPAGHVECVPSNYL
jgi:hypothetical protein